MKKLSTKDIRFLGIAPSSRGFGFAVMVAGNTLIDWGVKAVKGGNKNGRSLSNVGNLIAHYKPSVVAIPSTLGSRRGSRVQELTDEIVALCEDENIKTRRFSRRQLNLNFFQNGRGTKQALAECLAARFPEELGFRLPRKRRPWTSEDYQMDIFDAVALAQSCFPCEKGTIRK